MLRDGAHGVPDCKAKQDMPEKTQNPKVSVIIPTFNRAQLLRRALRSVRSQTWQDYEVIVVDDHSSDGTTRMIGELEDSRIECIRHTTNRGQSAALNTGIEKARGEYLAFLDDDDEWLAEKLAKQVEILDKAPNHVGLIYTWRELASDRQDTPAQPQPTRKMLRGDIYEDMVRLNLPLPPSTWMVRQETAQSIGGFDETLRVAKDQDFMVRLCVRGWHVEVLPEVMVVKHLHGLEQLTDPTRENFAVRAQQIKKHMQTFKRDLRGRTDAKMALYRMLLHYELPYATRSQLVALTVKTILCDPFGMVRRVLTHRRLSLDTAKAIAARGR